MVDFNHRMGGISNVETHWTVKCEGKVINDTAPKSDNLSFLMEAVRQGIRFFHYPELSKDYHDFLNENIDSINSLTTKDATGKFHTEYHSVVCGKKDDVTKLFGSKLFTGLKEKISTALDITDCQLELKNTKQNCYPTGTKDYKKGHIDLSSNNSFHCSRVLFGIGIDRGIVFHLGEYSVEVIYPANCFVTMESVLACGGPLVGQYRKSIAPGQQGVISHGGLNEGVSIAVDIHAKESKLAIINRIRSSNNIINSGIGAPLSLIQPIIALSDLKNRRVKTHGSIDGPNAPRSHALPLSYRRTINKASYEESGRKNG